MHLSEPHLVLAGAITVTAVLGIFLGGGPEATVIEALKRDMKW